MTNLCQVLLDLDGAPLLSSKSEKVVEKNEEGEEIVKYNDIKEELSLGTAIDQALMYQDDESDPKVVEARYNLHKKVVGSEVIKFTQTELKLVKELVCKRWNVYIAGQIIDLI